MKKLLAFMLMFTFAIVLVGCGGDLVPQSVEITGTQTVEAGKDVQLTAAVLPEGVEQGVTWSSARTDIASVDTNGKVTGVKVGATIIRATSTAVETVYGQIRITVTASGEISKPDLGGYTIKIAQAGHALQGIDPFHPDYAAQNKVAKQQAWEWVEENYNCEIQVVAYPDDAEWGTPRWNYILNQAAAQTADYDFYTVPDARIGTFVEGQAIIDVSDWYALYGQGYMDAVYQQSGTYKGSLYSITDGESGIYNVMYYNINLLAELGMEKTPAEMFNEGTWTYTAFKDYAVAAQTALNAKGEGYWAVAGCSPYYWVGMTNAGGVKIADISTMKMNLKDPVAVQAATILKEIKAAGAMDPLKQVDQNVASWMNGKALFSSGDLWFVNTSNRWPENLWGEGELTKYGYVPFPRPDAITKAQQKLGLTGTATFVMPNFRDYSAFGAECTAENVYRALVDTFLKTKEFQEGAPGYDEQALLQAFAERYAESPDSVQAFMFIAGNAKDIGFYEPLAEPGNAVINTGYSTFSTEVNKFVMGDYASWADAIDPLIETLEENLRKAFS